jgi:hypothetical protein
MKRCIDASIFIFTVYCAALAQSTFTRYHDRNDFLLASPGALKFGLYGYDNPALLSSPWARYIVPCHSFLPELLIQPRLTRKDMNSWEILQDVRLRLNW